MATLGEIEAEVLRIVEDDPGDVTASTAIRTHVRRAQRAIEDRCAFDVQHAATFFVVTGSTFTFAIPDDFIGMRLAPAVLNRSTDKEYARLTEVADFTELGVPIVYGSPKYWTIASDSVFRVWPAGDGLGASSSPAGGYDVEVFYWKRLTTLTAPEDENYWTQNMDDVLAFRAAAFVFSELRDPQANWWSAVAAARFNEIRNSYHRNKIRQRDFRIMPAQSLSSQTQRNRLRDPRLDARVP